MDNLDSLKQIHTGEYIMVDKAHYNKMQKKIISDEFLLRNIRIALLDLLEDTNKTTILLEKLNSIIADLEVINE